MDNIFLSPIPIPELIDRIADQVVIKLKENHKIDTDIPSEYLSGKEVDEFLKISRPTRIKWAKDGILTKYRIGTKILYNREEVIKAMKAIEARRS